MMQHLMSCADKEAALIAALEQEMQGLKDDRAHVSKLRKQLEQASTRTEQEKATWERQKVFAHLCLYKVLAVLPLLHCHQDWSQC